MISFEPTDDQKMVRDSVIQFAARTLRPRIREFERARALPDDVLEAAHAMGLPLAAFPETVGGSGLGVVTQVLIEEELAHGDPAAAFALSGPGAYGWAALLFGGPELGKQLIAPFLGDGAHARFGAVAWGERKAAPDHAGFVTRAEKSAGGWTLHGEKSYVLHADRAQSFIVFAQVDASKGWDGVGAFVVPRDARGLRILPRLDTLGLDAASFGGVALDGVEVPEPSRLPHAGDVQRLASFFATQGLLVAARAVGLARAAFEVTRDYCEQRKAFGKPVGHFQAVAFTLADRSMELEAARAMVWRAASLWDAVAKGGAGADERAALLHTAWAVSFCLEAAMRAGDDAVQLHGGSGFMRDYPVEKWMRDAKQLQLCA
ncbi:MAG: acyl-CoA dehydrogenase family protein, partial [Polyangiaceae bacterium]